MEPLLDPKEAAAQWAGDARDIQHLVQSKGYNDWLEPFMMAMMRRYLEMLAEPTEARRAKYPDDYLRGAIKVIKELLRLPYNVLAEQEQRNAEEKVDLEALARYEDIAAGGRGPFGEDQIGLSPQDPI